MVAFDHLNDRQFPRKVYTPPVSLQRGLHFGYGTAEEAEDVHQNAPSYIHHQGGLGVHWTDNPHSAGRFALGESLSPEFDEPPEPGSHSLGVVLHGKTAARNVVDLNSEEGENYRDFDAVMEHDHPEAEVPVRENARVHVTHVESLTADDEGNMRSKMHPVNIRKRA